MFVKFQPLLIILFIFAAAPGCRPRPDAQPSPVETARSTQRESLLLTAVEPSGVDSSLTNALRITPRIYSGSQPQRGDFAQLRNWGVRTLVSVDGARPDIEAAAAHGLRYVHIPVGYDGVSLEAGLALAHLAKEVDGPFYIHCHHGRHRAPAAAAVACIAAGVATPKEALAILQRAGTSKDYAGLWRDVENYQPPEPGAALPELVAFAEVDSIAAAMANIDRATDHLALAKQAQWSVPEKHPDIVAAQEALILREALHEMRRHLPDDYDAKYVALLTEAEAIAIELHHALTDHRHAAAGNHLDRLLQSCRGCHVEFRN